MKVKFYRCPVCGNIITKMHDGGIIPVCCGKEMQELKANVTDGKQEYHVPVVEKTDDCHLQVKIGKEPHPMSKEHHIGWIFLETCDKDGHHGGRFVWLENDDKPEHTFCVCPTKVVNVYEYCNLHGLWKLEIPASHFKTDDAEKCGTYPAFCGHRPANPQEEYYSCD